MNWLIFILFFISGACGLIYEVVWSRMMLPIFGRSALAVGTVLAAFMLGLAIGSYFLGKLSDRSRNPLRLYAFYELGIGGAAFLASVLLTRSTPVYLWAHMTFGDSSLEFAICRFLIAFVPLLAPTILMGATLPILSRIVVTQLARVERDLGRLYAINTVGAVAGSLASGFFLIGHIGLHDTVYCAVAGNLTVGVLALLASSRFRVPNAGPLTSSPESPAHAPSSDNRGGGTAYRIILWSFALSGFASFAYEVFWTRSLVFLVGNTTYAFSLMLVAFLSGIALGGYGIRFAAARFKNHLRLFAALEILIGVFSASSLPILFSIVTSESVRSLISRMSGQLGFLVLSNFGVALILMLIPATLIGATFPLIGRIFLDDLKNTGTTVGKVYAVNTLGNVLGALLPGLVILPFLGIQKGILLMAALNVCIGIVAAFSRRKRALAVAMATAAAFAVCAVLLTHTSLGFQFPSEFQTAKDETLFYREGGLVTTKVWASADTGYKIISVDGIGIGGTSDSDYKQQILAHLPKLLLKSYRSELTVGFGSGILAGESGRHPALQRIVCVELARGVVEGARYFTHENYDILNDPRTALVVDDIADFLQTSRERFDIISADEKTTGKYASNSMSYSKDYYALLREHLAPGGLVIQWMPADLPPSQYRLAMRTFLDSFPHVCLWYFPPVGRFAMSNTFLVGSNDPIDINPAWMRQAMEKNPEAFEGIRKYGLTTAESILAHFVATDETLRTAFPPGPVNSFERPYYEFYSPRDYAVPSSERSRANHEMLMSFRGVDTPATLTRRVSPPDKARLDDAFRAEGIFFAGYALQLQGEMNPSVMQYYDRAIGTAPGNMSLRNEVVAYLNNEVQAYFSRGDTVSALACRRRAAELYPENAEVHYDYALMLLYVNETETGIAELRRALTLNPRSVPALRNLGVAYAGRGQMDTAVELWRQALAIDPDDVETLVFFGSYLAEQKGSREGVEYLKRAYRLAPHNPQVVDRYTLDAKPGR